MNKVKAMQTIERLLKTDFKYIYKKENLDFFELNLTFQMDSNTHELQTNIKFLDEWFDVLAFISPSVLKVGSGCYWEAIQTVNHVNWYTKGAGRFYVDAYGDLAYSLRINYDFLEKEPNLVIKNINETIDFYSDLFIPFLDVCLGKKTFNEAKQFIDSMWGVK